MKLTRIVTEIYPLPPIVMTETPYVATITYYRKMPALWPRLALAASILIFVMAWSRQ